LVLLFCLHLDLELCLETLFLLGDSAYFLFDYVHPRLHLDALSLPVLHLRKDFGVVAPYLASLAFKLGEFRLDALVRLLHLAYFVFVSLQRLVQDVVPVLQLAEFALLFSEGVFHALYALMQLLRTVALLRDFTEELQLRGLRLSNFPPLLMTTVLLVSEFPLQRLHPLT